MRRFRSRSAFALVALVALMTAACAKPDDPGVGVNPIAADIVFGVKDTDPAAPANTPGSDITEEEATGDDFLDDEFFQPTKSTKGPFLRPQRPVADCPAASVDEFPDEPASETVYPPKRLPREGVYRWKRSGEQVINDFKTEVSGFEERIIRDVEVISEEEEAPKTSTVDQFQPRIQYTYRTIQPEFGSGLVVITDWFVDSNAAVEQEVNNNSPAVRANAGQAERGLVIRRIERKSSSGDRIPGGVTNFPAGAGLLMLPLPIRQGNQWTSTATDPTTGRTISIEGQIRDRERVDACGQIVDGWRVKATLSTEAGPRAYDYIVATQYGAVLIFESFEGSTETGSAKVAFTLGQQDPDPLPAEEAGSQ